MNDRTSETQTQQEASVRESAPESTTEVTDVRDRTDLSDTDSDSGFLPDDRMQTLRAQWSELQATFVDDPRKAVEEAHGLVTQIVNDLTSTFTRERSDLESQWSGGEPDTEKLRIALQRYRSFFNRLLGTTNTD